MAQGDKFATIIAIDAEAGTFTHCDRRKHSPHPRRALPDATDYRRDPVPGCNVGTLAIFRLASFTGCFW